MLEHSHVHVNLVLEGSLTQLMQLGHTQVVVTHKRDICETGKVHACTTAALLQVQPRVYT